MKDKILHFLIYKITNIISGKYYIGAHKTKNINDSYMGSGKYLKRAIKKYGIENFKKEILFELENEIEMFNMEKELVNEDFLKNKNVYNITTGGFGNIGYNSKGKVSVKDKYGNTCQVSINDPRYLSGELVNVNTGTVTVKNIQGIYSKVKIDDERLKTGELTFIFAGKIVVKDKDDTVLTVDVNDERYLRGELKHINTNKTNVRDKAGNNHYIDKNDKRILDGEFSGHSINTVLVRDENNKYFRIDNTNKDYLSGKYRTSTSGLLWIYNIKTDKNKRILPEKLDEYINDGWSLGRRPKGFYK